MVQKERVTRVIDGDTFETTRRKHSVRLANVDTPEKRQPGYQAAKRALAKAILNKEVTVDTVGRSYGRAVGKVKIGNKSVNNIMKPHDKRGK